MKIGLMSFAHPHALSYAAGLTAIPGVEVRATDPDSLQRPGGESGGPALAASLGVGYFPSYPELLAWQPDGVVICSENAKHRELVELSAEAGVEVLCEKPIATNLLDARAMIEAVGAADVKLMIAHPVRFSPAFAALRSACEAGVLGQLIAVTGTNTGQLPVGSRAWFVDPLLAGGGSLMDHTVHVADLLDGLFTDARATNVYAATNRLLHRDRVPVETGGLISVRYSNGVIATIDCSWSKPDSFPTWGGLTLQVVGTEGIADLDAFGARVEGHSETARNALWLPFGMNTDQLLVAEFVNAITEGRRPQPDGEVGYRTLEIVVAGYQSVRTGQPVSLNSAITSDETVVRTG